MGLKPGGGGGINRQGVGIGRLKLRPIPAGEIHVGRLLNSTVGKWSRTLISYLENSQKVHQSASIQLYNSLLLKVNPILLACYSTNPVLFFN